MLLTQDERSITWHTHLVRGGFVMLWPTKRAPLVPFLLLLGRLAAARRPKRRRGWIGSAPHACVGDSIKDPPLTRWVCCSSDAD